MKTILQCNIEVGEKTTVKNIEGIILYFSMDDGRKAEVFLSDQDRFNLSRLLQTN